MASSISEIAVAISIEDSRTSALEASSVLPKSPTISVELLDLLCQTERTVEGLAEESGMSVANTSQHLQLLEAARLVEARRNGRFVV